VRVAVADLDGDRLADVVTGAGDRAGSAVLGYTAVSLTTASREPAIDLDAFPGMSGGVYVG
jgi:hypothetical protein